LSAGLLLFLLSGSTAAQATAAIDAVPCTILTMIWSAFEIIAPTLVILYFMYGGVTYVYSAEDAGGRKKGMKICQHAMIGGILISLVQGIMVTIGITGTKFLCPGIP